MAKKYTVAIMEYAYKLEYKPKKVVGAVAVGYHRRVLADSRIGALEKCLADIRKELHKVQGKYLSVHVGETHNPTASAIGLQPIQIVIETGEVRNPLKYYGH